MPDYISERTNEYEFQLSQSLNNPATGAYWIIQKKRHTRLFSKPFTMVRKYLLRKYLLIPPLNKLPNHNPNDFQEKADFYNLYFGKKCTPIKNDNSIPTETNYLCNATILAVDFEDQDILKIIWALDINKAHGQDNISTYMIKIFDASIVKLLSIIFCNSWCSGIFLDNWKRSNKVPVHKKGNKLSIQNYHPVSFLSISSKIFERLIFNLPCIFVKENSLFCSNQSGLRKTDSCVNRLLSIVQEMFESFNNFPCLETRSKFLDMSKPFDRVWHEGLIYKLNLLTLF